MQLRGRLSYFCFSYNPHTTLFYERKIRENQRDNQKWIIQRHSEHWANTTQDDKKTHNNNKKLATQTPAKTVGYCVPVNQTVLTTV